MKKFLVILLGMCSLLMAGTVEDIINQADTAAEVGNLEEAVEILEAGIKEHKNSADLYAKYGLYLSQRAGEVSFMKAGMLSSKAEKQFIKALEIAPGHMEATLYRGILFVNMPKFLGKLDAGITDLKFVQNRYGANQELYLVTSYYLGHAYQKNDETEKAASCFEHIVIYGKNSSYYEDAKKQYELITGNTEYESTEDHYKLAMEFLEKNDDQNAVIHFRQAAKEQQDNLELHLLYARTLGNLAEKGYDDTIQEDVTARAKIAHEVFEVLNQCVVLAPENEEIRMLRGSVAINLPFFVNSLDTGIEDLRFLAENSESAEMKGQAGYLLKQAEDKKLTYELAESGYIAETDEEKEDLLKQFVQTESPIQQEKPEGRYLQIDMTLGYRDQIAPQTAVWIEDTQGNYISTIYVSDFASSVKEQQVHLPNWAQKSKFQQVASVTGASIDCGRHTFYWDFTDHNGAKYTENEFIVMAEICHWPHVQYTRQSLKVDISEQDSFLSKGDKYLIVQLSANYIEN